MNRHLAKLAHKQAVKRNRARVMCVGRPVLEGKDKALEEWCIKESVRQIKERLRESMVRGGWPGL
jgi:hypothetical protein